ncbi:flagellar protein FliS [Oxobacter pfennigii]|uniref:Flagellar protein FliS n=1 Tax=Oxobacter pfennigii TaxID=36849 RepID=A0A0P8YC34_9CLOT|nr:flagellar export chaperone FliS [Oxobacter pfennigii]KPU44678.1 flagellar protein FliS [Oxobacter pfennigii]
MYNQTSNAYQVYRDNEVLMASRGKLLVMLYEGAMKFLRYAQLSIDDKNYEEANKYFQKTQDIISELMVTLNMDFEVSKGLYSLYDYMKYRLVQANIKKDKEMIDEVYKMLSELKETWEKAMTMI